MKYFIYDTETTGLTRSSEVIQFAGFVTDDNLSLLKSIDFYCYTQVPIDKQASEVHGITSNLLRELSGGRTFEDCFYETELSTEKDLIWVSYSTNGFDERMINQTLKQNGLSPYNFGKEARYLGDVTSGIGFLNAEKLLRIRCFNGRKNRLRTLIELAGYADMIDSMFMQIFGSESANHLKYHDALFDAFSLWALLSTYKNRLS